MKEQKVPCCLNQKFNLKPKTSPFSHSHIFTRGRLMAFLLMAVFKSTSRLQLSHSTHAKVVRAKREKLALLQHNADVNTAQR